jgi:hypothetical protein
MSSTPGIMLMPEPTLSHVLPGGCLDAGALSHSSKSTCRSRFRWPPILWSAVALVMLFAGVNVQAQAPAPTVPPEPAFPKLFPKYTGLNGYEDLVMAADLINGNEAVTAAEKEDATLKEMRKALEDPTVDRALQLAHLGLDKPIQSPRDPDKLDEETLLPEYAGFRRIARVLAIEEYVALADGRLSKAIDIMRDGLRLGYDVQSETLIAGLVGIAVDAIVLERLASHFDQMALRDCYQLIGVAQEWLKLPSPAETVVSNEHRGFLNMMNAWKKDPERLRKVIKSLEPADAPMSEDDIAAVELSDFVNTNTAGIGAVVDQAIALADAEYRARITEIRKPAWQRKPLRKLETRATMAHRLCSLVSSSYEQALAKFDTDCAKIHLLGVHAAIHKFHWENNRLPGSLEELKLPALTTDPFTGAPLIYKLTGITYELSSAGSPPLGGGASASGPIYLPRKPR